MNNKIPHQIRDICPACNGSKRVAGKSYKGKKCPQCSGKGTLIFNAVGKIVLESPYGEVVKYKQ
jgi:DnaJ-class molecular chaperone